MANLNDFKLLSQKSLNCFNLARLSWNVDPKKLESLTEVEKSRFGFYYFVIQNLTDLSEYDDITDSICDQDFNSKLFDVRNADEGIDAVCIDEDNKTISLFNFKYRDNFNTDREQSKNEALLSSKFLSVLQTENNTLHGNLKQFASELIERYNSSDIWDTYFYIVSNENKTLNKEDTNLKNFADIYGVNVITIGLNEIIDFISIRPNSVNAILNLDTDAVMSFTENTLSSNKSYIVRLPLTELIRITCNNENIRNKYNIEHEENLSLVNIDYHVLFDNVRGLIEGSKFNKNIINTLDSTPSKFFFYNNGLTIVADDILSESVNSGKKIKLDIKNFQVLNGGQTLRTIHNYNKSDTKNITDKLAKAEILVRILKVTDNELKNSIGEYTNSQNAIDLIDLKSLRKEQIQLEVFLADFQILYIRKKGNTGISSNNYKHSIGIQRLGQILLATLKGSPEQTSNKKKEIFSNYYEDLFVNNESLITLETVDLIMTHIQITQKYKQTSFSKSEQKYMYILYLSYQLKRYDYDKLIKEFESFLTDYKNEHKLDISLARILITAKFKSEIDKKYSII